MEQFDVIFTSPGGASHITFLVELIDATPSGESIHMCVSHLDDGRIVDALRRAVRRGATARVILRTDSATDFAAELRRAGVVTTVGAGCFGDKLHTKFYLFSRTTIRRTSRTGVSMFGSGTLTRGSEAKQENHVAVSDPQLYDQMVAHWNDMERRAHDSSRIELCAKTFFSSTNKVKTYMFPFDDDVVAGILDNLHAIPNRTTGEVPLVRIAMARWTTERSNLVGVILRKLASGPCRFEIVLRNAGENGVAPSVIETFTTVAQFLPGRLVVRVADGRIPEQNIHSKYFTIEGHYGAGRAWERLVWMGSPNWTKSGFAKNDEAMFKIRDNDVFDHYTKNHRTLMDLSSR